VLGFDYDGTLTPLVAHPDLAHLDPAMRAVLARLAAVPGVMVGVVSGRGLDNLISKVGLRGLHYGGTCGLELELSGERVIAIEPPYLRRKLHQLRAAIDARLHLYPGAWMEHKPFGFTLHYRLLATEQIAPLRSDIAALLTPHRAELLVLDGPLAIEVLPDLQRDKGTALQALVAHGDARRPTTVFYAGDASNDAPALTTAAALGGIALGIGPEPPAVAEYRLPDPAALHNVLVALAEALTDSRITLGVSPY
jgi:trehalose 6-phosphate phosphatase